MICRLRRLFKVVYLDLEIFEMFLLSFSECSLGGPILRFTFLRAKVRSISRGISHRCSPSWVRMSKVCVLVSCQPCPHFLSSCHLLRRHLCHQCSSFYRATRR